MGRARAAPKLQPCDSRGNPRPHKLCTHHFPPEAGLLLAGSDVALPPVTGPGPVPQVGDRGGCRNLVCAAGAA